MSKKILTLIILVLLLGVFGIFIVQKDKVSQDSTNDQTASSTEVKYTTTHLPEEQGGLYVHSMSGSFGTIYATTSSINNPYSSCEEEFGRTKPEVIDTNKINKTCWNKVQKISY